MNDETKCSCYSVFNCCVMGCEDDDGSADVADEETESLSEQKDLFE